MKPRRFKDDEIPYFSWDRSLTAGAIKQSLRTLKAFEWSRLAAWIMREAAFADVWQFLKPKEVYENYRDLEPFLGRRKAFWKYIMSTWHELGKI